MSHRFARRAALIALSPLLAAEAVWTRLRTTRLPEADGPRTGRRGTGRPLRLLVIGDSAAAGVGADHFDASLAGQLIDELARDHRVQWRVLARSGATTEAVLRWLARESPGTFDVAVTSVGVNDLTARTSRAEFAGRLHRLVDALENQCGCRQVILSGLPPMHRFPALPQPLRYVIGQRAFAFDRQIQRVADARGQEHIALNDLDVGADGVAADGFHPGPPAYAAWAERAAKRIRLYQHRDGCDADTPAPESRREA